MTNLIAKIKEFIHAHTTLVIAFGAGFILGAIL